MFDLELKTTKIEETLNENGKSIMKFENDKERIEKDIIQIQSEMVMKANYETQMKEYKKKLQKIES